MRLRHTIRFILAQMKEKERGGEGKGKVTGVKYEFISIK
jgi:hypothetical protein